MEKYIMGWCEEGIDLTYEIFDSKEEALEMYSRVKRKQDDGCPDYMVCYFGEFKEILPKKVPDYIIE